jgi:hypothetical protein
MFPMKPRNVMETRVMIILLFNESDEDMRRRVIIDMRVRIQEAVGQNGGDAEQMLS